MLIGSQDLQSFYYNILTLCNYTYLMTIEMFAYQYKYQCLRIKRPHKCDSNTHEKFLKRTNYYVYSLCRFCYFKDEDEN